MKVRILPMRTSEEKEALFVEVARKSVRKCFSKKALAKRSFSEEEMKEIVEIDAFLRKVSLSQLSRLERDVAYPNNYFCVAIRVRCTVANEEYETFEHKYILESDFNYKKDKLYIAKGIWLANQNKHFEVYYCVNLLRPRYGEGSRCLPRRCTPNASMTSCIFCDLDLEEPYASMDDETLLDTFVKENSELVAMLNPMLVRSGKGMHLYVLLEDSIDLSKEEEREHWKNLSKTLSFLLRNYNVDYKVIDCVRILRCIHSVNRKEKYGKEGKKVALLRDSNERIALDELEYKLDFLMQGGGASVFESILEEIIVDDEASSEAPSGFFFVEFDDDIFTDEVRPYVPPQYVIDEYNHIMRREEERAREKSLNESIPQRTKTQEELEEEREERTFLLEKLHSKKQTYQGIMVSYDELPKVMWQNRDLLFWISNRSSIEGYRNSLLFFFCFNTYYFEKIRNENTLYERLHYYNEKFFKPKLKERELRIQVSICFKKFEKETRTRHIKNETIQKLFPFEEEEKAYTIGNYYDINSNEHIAKQRKRHNKESLNYYYNKVRNNERIDFFNSLEELRKKECYEYIKENPYETYTNARKIISIGERQFYDLRKAIQKELGIYKEKVDYYEPFRKNINIKYDEYNKIFPCTRCTYHRRKKRYLNK